MVINQLEQQRQALRNQQYALSLELEPDPFSQQILADYLAHLANSIAQLKAWMNQLVGEQYQ